MKIEKINKFPFLGIFEFFFIKRYPNHLGRWKILKENKKIFQRIDRSNIDNCGTCFLHYSNSKNKYK